MYVNRSNQMPCFYTKVAFELSVFELSFSRICLRECDNRFENIRYILIYFLIYIFILFSVGYTMDDIVYKCLPSSVEFDENIQIPQFKLEDFTKSDCSQNYTTGTFWVF